MFCYLVFFFGFFCCILWVVFDNLFVPCLTLACFMTLTFVSWFGFVCLRVFIKISGHTSTVSAPTSVCCMHCRQITSHHLYGQSRRGLQTICYGMFILFKHLEYFHLLHISRSLLNQATVIYKHYKCHLISFLVFFFLFWYFSKVPGGLSSASFSIFLFHVLLYSAGILFLAAGTYNVLSWNWVVSC